MAEEELEIEGGKKKSSSKLIIMIAAVLLGIGVGAGSVFFLVGGDDEEQVVDAEPVKIQSMYHRFEKPFIVTIITEGKQRYLQVGVTVKTKQQKVINLIKTHEPVVKSALNNVFGAQELDYLQTAQGREELSQEALDVVQTFITAKDEALIVDKVLFTDFVMQ